MTRPLDKHLDNDELDALVSLRAASASPSGGLSEQGLGEARSHVEFCPDCSRKVQMHASVQGEILRMGLSGNMPLGPDCVADTEWLNVAAGLLPEAKTTELMKHAAQCGHCGPLLRAAAQTLSDDATPDEETFVASLSSARPDWRGRMADTLRATTKVPPRREKGISWLSGLSSWKPAFALAMVVLVVTVGWLGTRMLYPQSAEKLLAQAYTERRTLEVRIPGAKYAPLKVERTGGASNIDKPASLLEAEFLISEKLRNSPNDPVWLQAKARADLLDGNYESAIKTLQRALEVQPDSPQLQADLGAAYFVRAKSTERPVDYGYAIDSLGKALAKSPDDPIALFNRALASERIFLYAQAIDDWEHYLRIDPQGEWAAEARNRLTAIQEKVKNHRQGQVEPLLRPSEIAEAGIHDSAVQTKIDSRVEEYVRLAIIEWLPQAFPVSPVEPSEESRAALLALAEVTALKHDDYWLKDLLSRPTGAHFPSGLRALAASLVADDRGDYSAAYNFADLAVQVFRGTGNPAAELRAQAEEVHADHLLWEGQRCISLLNSLDKQLKRNNYGWLRGQMSLERSNCASIVGDLGTYESAITAGIHEAQIHNYTPLFLRGLGFQALSSASIGDESKAIALAVKGLGIFWSQQVDVTKGYNFYTHLDAAANELHLSNFQVALWEEATALLDGDSNILRQAMAYRWYGNAAYLANMPALAASQFSKAAELFAASPKTAATARDRMDAEVWTANAEIRQGDLDRASARLRDIKATLDDAPAFDPEIGFYSAQADIALRRADSDVSESAVRSAVFLAEWALTSFSAEADRRHWAEETRTAYRDAVEWKLRQGDTAAALELWEWYRGAELRAIENVSPHKNGGSNIAVPPDPQNAPSLPSPTAVANRLPLLRDETVITYAMFSDGVAVWAYDDRGIFSRWISTPSIQVEELTARFERLCSDPSSDLAVLRTTARSLYDLLITPIEDRLTAGRTLLIEPIDFLTALPWEALVDREGHYVTERRLLVVMPGLYRWMRLRPSVAIGSGTPALIVSVSVAAEPDLQALSDAETEAHAVFESFSSARWLQGSNATVSAIREELSGKAVFHFAGHAIAAPQRTGLVLAEIDSRTQRSRLFTADSLSPTETGELQLAVLSACDTGAEAQPGDSATETLVQALLYSGVPHVVASRWNVDSRETANFMKRFYTQILSGGGVAESIRLARLGLVSKPGSAHPYYWAAFELEGKN